MGALVRTLFGAFLLGGLVIGTGFVSAPRTAAAQEKQDAAAIAPAGAASMPAPDNPVADPKAIVTAGHARFTILTPQLIRMEWSADGKFEDHASLVFINRRLPVPKFTQSAAMSTPGSTEVVTISTSALTLRYIRSGLPGNDGHFTADNLSIELTVDSKKVIWHPGDTDPENLQGTTRTLDGALGSKTKEPIGEGLISRSGWALVDDSTRPLFDSADFRFLQGEKSPWPWA
ncbi:MAG: hypothetical protein WBC92_06130, partial [Terracidiphilus sp.]